MKYVCELCGLIYDEDAGYPSKGIAPGTKFQDLPDDFECPGCYSEKQAFYQPGDKQGIRTSPAPAIDPRPGEVKLVSDR